MIFFVQISIQIKTTDRTFYHPYRLSCLYLHPSTEETETLQFARWALGLTNDTNKSGLQALSYTHSI